MFPATIALANASAVDKNFTQIRLEDSGSVRIDESTNTLTPRKMAIRHSVSGKPDEYVDRALVQFSTVAIDSNGVPRTLVMNFTLAVPRNAAITRTHINDSIAFLRDFLGDTVMVDGLLLGKY